MKIYQIDAFTNKLFSGNPAAVCVLDKFINETLMQSIAAENNLSETAFILNTGHYWDIRWFSPTIKVDLCGHATLAAAKVIFDYLGHEGDMIQFVSPRSGKLTVSKLGNILTLNFPADEINKVTAYPKEIDLGLKQKPLAVYEGKTDYMCIYASEKEIAEMKPDFTVLSWVDSRGIIVTAPGENVDFVSRFFAPQAGIPEDPVTGSAHTTLTPYWTKVLNKENLSAIQLSKRKGFLTCCQIGDRIEISGEAMVYMVGEIFIES